MLVLAVVFAAMISSSGAAIPQTGEQVALAIAAPEEIAPAPRLGSKNIIADLVTSAIQKVSSFLRIIGIDPLNIGRKRFGVALPVPSLFAFGFSLQSLKFAGVSNIIVNYVDYGLLTSRLEFDFSWPLISLFINESEMGLRVFSHEMVGQYSGNISFRDVGCRGNARISMGILTGIKVRELRIYFYFNELIAKIKSCNLMGKDFTKEADLFINEAVFRTIKDHEKDIGELIELVVTRIIDQIL